MSSGKGIPLSGDRSVFDALNYQNLHTNDIDNSANAIHHTLGNNANQGSPGNHSHVISHMVVFALEGNLEIGTKPLRIYNPFGITATFDSVFLSVNTPPTGQAIIADIHKNDSTIFANQGNRPQIAADAYTGSTQTFDTTTWAAGEYLQLCIDQVGSLMFGAFFTAHIVFHWHIGQ